MIERQAEREQQAVEMIEVIEARDEQPLDDDAGEADDDRRQHQRAPIRNAEIVEQHPRAERAHHVLGAVREVDHVHEPEDHRQPQRQQRVERAVDQAQQQLAEQRLRRYAKQFEHRSALRHVPS